MTTPIPQVDTFGNINNLLALISGKPGSTTTSSQTTKGNISQEGVNSLIQQILQGTQGLGAVTSGERSSGLYNSTTNQQLVNDLLARTTAAVAEKQAGTTTTSTQTTKNAPGISKGAQSAIIPLLALKALSGSQTGKAAGKALGGKNNPLNFLDSLGADLIKKITGDSSVGSDLSDGFKGGSTFSDGFANVGSLISTGSDLTSGSLASYFGGGNSGSGGYDFSFGDLGGGGGGSIFDSFLNGSSIGSFGNDGFSSGGSNYGSFLSGGSSGDFGLSGGFSQGGYGGGSTSGGYNYNSGGAADYSGGGISDFFSGVGSFFGF